MGVPTSEVGYTPAMPRREDHEVHRDMWWHWTKKKNIAMNTSDNLLYINEPDESNPLTLYFLKNNFNIFLRPKLRSSVPCLDFLN